MKKRVIFLSFLLAMVTLVSICACSESQSVDTNSSDTLDTSVDTSGTDEENYNYGDVKISSISELNLSGEVDDHAATKGNSVLELNFREHTEIPRSVLATTNPYYPRMKKVSDDRYLLFYNTGKTDPSCYYSSSSDLVNWEKGKALFEGTSSTHYATCDALVLDSGDVIAVASFRPTDWGSYTGDMTKSGLVLRRSTDGGKTWSDEQKIYTGMNWECFLLETESGEIHCYFTHTAPYTSIYGYDTFKRSSGIGLIRSTDGGKSWTPNVTEAPYSADVASQTYIGERNGHKMFTEQMPAVVQLHNGNFLMACESMPDLQSNDVFRLTITRSYDNWKKIDLHSQGPADKQTINGVHASGPYVAQMFSGETVISYYGKDGFNIIVGNSEGKNFGSAMTPLVEHNKTYWGSLEVVGSHALVGVCDDDTKAGNVAYRRITLGTMYLNHDIKVKDVAVSIDGNGEEWSDNTDALFVGSTSQAQASVRFTEDADNVYVLIERLDDFLEASGDEVNVFFGKKGSSEYYKLSVSVDGVGKLQLFKNKKPSAVDGGYEGVVVVVGSVGNESDTDLGYCAEVKISKAALGFSLADGVQATLSLDNTDKKTEYDTDTICGHSLLEKDGWVYIGK